MYEDLICENSELKDGGKMVQMEIGVSILKNEFEVLIDSNLSKYNEISVVPLISQIQYTVFIYYC